MNIFQDFLNILAFSIYAPNIIALKLGLPNSLGELPSKVTLRLFGKTVTIFMSNSGITV